MLTRDFEVPDRLPYSLPSYAKASQSLCFTAAPIVDCSSALESSALLSALVDALPNGLLVLSVERAIIYWNQNAKRLCQTLSSTQRYWSLLPAIVTEMCEQVTASAATEPVLLEYETPDRRSFRLTASWLPETMGSLGTTLYKQNNQTFILVTVEDRDEVLQQDIQIEQKKFHLTNREAEVWLLLKREYSYQAIAKTLHISLNTVKTHIRNIHAKRHPYQSLPA